MIYAGPGAPFVQVLRRYFLRYRRESQVTIGTDLRSVPIVTFSSPRALKLDREGSCATCFCNCLIILDLPGLLCLQFSNLQRK